MKKTLLCAAVALTLVTSQANASTKEEAANAITAAVNAVLEANSVGGEWRDSFKTIGKAKDAFRGGDYGTAVKLANKAKNEGANGKAQSMAEQSASVPGYIRDGAK
jgi:type II secretory pathway pseudopilin PulG